MHFLKIQTIFYTSVNIEMNQADQHNNCLFKALFYQQIKIRQNKLIVSDID